MKLIRDIDNVKLTADSKYPIGDFCIYELDADESSMVQIKFGRKANFYVSHNKFGDHFMATHTFRDILNEQICVSPAYFNGFFQTQLEAYYHIKLIEAVSLIDNMEWKIKAAVDIDTYDHENRCMITETSDKLNVKFFPLTEEKPNISDHPEFN